MSATPSTVTRSPSSYSSTCTPRARSSSTAARMSGTRQTICVWVSDVPMVLCEIANRAASPVRNTIRSSTPS